ncbi:MAG: lipoyl(octanoyl) transferase LipB [Candidatus Brocadiae bacterium]|nr:lipoyl(octanoyl) transferase LipB [Candidatus Brocadiia bacterium]
MSNAVAQPELAVIGLRRLHFQEAFGLQERLRDACIASDGRRNYLVLTEHPPTITVGRSGDRRDVLAGQERLRGLGFEVVETNRGGEVTYHGPGQLVAYPVIGLRDRGRDLHRYLRDLEAWLVRLCRSYGVEAHADSPHTGVWVEDRKIASIGIAVRRWVTYHGVALNVATDLSHFGLIVPCGLGAVTITSLERELGSAPPLKEVAERAAGHFAEDFGLALRTAIRHR